MNTETKSPSIGIIGAGFSGLCTAIRLKQAGHHDLTIFERGDEVGGVWRENTYPGAACDVPWHLYSFSFEHRTGFSCPYPEQPDILEYQKFCARKYKLYPHCLFNTTVEKAVFDEQCGQWFVHTDDGHTRSFDVLVTGVGQLSRPAWPNIEGKEDFRGHSFHSAQWDHDYDLTGKKVAVIGTGASAIQFVPEIAEDVEQLTVFQRSAPYLLPRFQREYGQVNKWLFDTFPHYRDIFRFGLFSIGEISAPAFHGQSRLADFARWWARKHLESQIEDPELRRKLTPDYPIGCKRVLFSSNYYPTLTRDNVDLVDAAVARIVPEGLVTEGGGTYEADAIIYGTGFAATEFLAPIEIRGRGGKTLSARWSNGAEAYLGLTVDGFPNLFMCYGPNTNLGGNSIIFMIECQAQYILDSVEKLRASGKQTMEVKPEVINQFNRKLQEELDDTVWKWGCSSWYHTDDGRITNNWPNTNTRYRRLTKKADLEDFRLSA